MLSGVNSHVMMPSSDAEELITEKFENLGDPFDVLKLLGDKLGKEGNIKDTSSVAFFQSLMKNSDKLVSQCISISVLSATKDDNTVILKILNEGAWKTLYGWLQDAKSALNKPFLVELLKLYQELPVTVELLKQNGCAKDIKHLIKCSDDEISKLAKVIVEKWMLQVKEKTGEGIKKIDKESNHSSNHVSSKSSRDGKSSTKTTSIGSNHSHQSSHKSRTSEDKNLSNSSQVNSGNSGMQDNSNQDSSSSSCASVTKNTVQRPKTVKTIGSMFRSTGLEVESPLPHSKRKNSNSQNSAVPVSSAKKTVVNNVDKKTTVAVASTSTTTAVSLSSPTDTRPKVKLIPARTKPPEIFESSGFIDALGTTEILPGRRKRKLSQINTSAAKTSSSSSVVSAVSPLSDEKKPLVPSFYRDTLEMSQEELAKLSGNSTEKGRLSPTGSDHTSTTADSIVDSTGVSISETKMDDSENFDENTKNVAKTDEVVEPPPKKKKVPTATLR